MVTDIALAGLALLLFFFVAAAQGEGQAAPAPAPPRVREVSCGADIAIVSLTPTPARGSEDTRERLTIESREVVPVELDGWSLVSGRRRTRLDGMVVSALVPVTIYRHPLRDAGGDVRLTDPCGLVASHVSWSPASPK